MTTLVQEWSVRMLNVAVQGGLAVGIALLITSMLPRLSATTKVWLLRLALVKLLLSGLFVGGISLVSLPSPSGSSASDSSVLTALAFIACGLWTLSVVLGLKRHVASHRKLTDLVHQSESVTDPEIRTLYGKLCRQFGIKHAPALVTHIDIASPLLIKNGTTTIVLPETLIHDEDTGRLEVALAHELAHHRHRDLRWGWLIAAVDILFFFHPLVALATKKLRLYEEYAADAAAMRATESGPSTYARTLLSFAEMTIAFPGAYAMADSAKELDRRIKEAYGARKPRRRGHALVAALAILVASATLIPWTIGDGSKPVASTPTGVFAPVAGPY